MFDIGFWELSIIGVVALLVVGPERLPALARTVGLYAGKLRRWITQVRGEVERELRAEEIRQAMRDTETGEAVRGLKEAVRMDDVKDAFRTAGTAIKDAADAAGKGAGADAAVTPRASNPAPAVPPAAVEQLKAGEPAPAAPGETAGDAATSSTDGDSKRERGAG